MSDIIIYVIDRLGVRHELLAPVDMNMNLMELCKSYELPVEGICGGMAMCASCQVYVYDRKFFGQRSENEELMLSDAFHVKENSRLGCQIFITKNLHQMVVELAPDI